MLIAPRASRNAPLVLSIAALVAAGLTGCQTTRQSFRIQSVPPGATIFVDGEPRGTTDAEKVVVDFASQDAASLRLERAGYQPAGVVLRPESPAEHVFVLARSPANEEILREIGELRRQVDELAARVEDLRRRGREVTSDGGR